MINIERCLKNFDINKEIIIKRLNFIKKEMKINLKRTERLGPVLPLPLKNFKNINNLSKNLLIRHHSDSIEKKTIFKKHILLPLHFKISKKEFNKYFKLIQKNYIK